MRNSELYSPSLTLLTDLYQLTMAYGYWKSGLAEREACFHLTFRRAPFRGGYAIAAGLGDALDFLSHWGFDADDVAYLGSLRTDNGAPLFEEEFLAFLEREPFRCDVDGITEGTAVFPHEPLLRISGPLYQCQLVETPLLNMLNFETLIATKAARIAGATGGEPVLEFGLRRAQGISGGIAASRAAFVGGCAATSNVLAGRLYDIPVKGTHAHSWVMTFGDELASFRAYAEAMPDNCVFLVDTYDTLQGVRHAIEVGHELRARGHEMRGIRLDSGDLAELSIGARQLLDEAGFPDAAVVASNDLDEFAVQELKERGAKIGVWGIGTKLATAYDQPALGGVYKLGALRNASGDWEPRIKLSEVPIKVSNPGRQGVRRYFDGDRPVGDMIYNLDAPPGDAATTLGPEGEERHWDEGLRSEDLLVPVMRAGESVYTPPSLTESRARTLAQLAALPESTRSLSPDATPYPTGLEKTLYLLKEELMRRAKETS